MVRIVSIVFMSQTLVHERENMNKGLSVFLDLSRWVAAILVLVTHLNNRMFIHFGGVSPNDRSIGLYIWTFVCGFAHHAVVIFFVLSGFLVGGKLMRDAKKIDYGYLSKYSIARISRIYTVLIPALALTTLLDWVGASYLNGADVYSIAEQTQRLNLVTLLGNVVNLQNIFFLTYGTDNALWTLASEFWYYMTAPLLLAPFTQLRGRLRWFLFAIGCTLLVVFTIRSPDYGAGFALWTIGAAAAVMPGALIKRPGVAIACFLVSVVGFRLVIRSHQMDQFWIRFGSDLIVSGLLAIALISLRFADTIQFWGSSFHKGMADFSYSLYAIHTPIIMFCCAALETAFSFGWKELPIGWTVAAGAFAVLLIVLVCAYLFSRVTEVNTSRVRTRLARLLNISHGHVGIREDSQLAQMKR